jgi:molybdopterin-binding protein
VVAVTVDVGTSLVAHLTSASLREMDLTIGSSVHLIFKATAVHVFQRVAP